MAGVAGREEIEPQAQHETEGSQAMGGYHTKSHSAASPPEIWALLMVAETWPTWSPIDELMRDEPAAGSPATAVGTTRTFRTGNAVTSERIIELVRERLLAYDGVDNFVLKDYRAAVELVPAPGGGTDIRWHATFRTRFGLGWMMTCYMQWFMRRMVRGLAAAGGGCFPHEATPR